MSKYRNILSEQYNKEFIGSVVGCGLDRLKRDVTSKEINLAIEYYKSNKQLFNRDKPIGEQREKIKLYIEQLNRR